MKSIIFASVYSLIIALAFATAGRAEDRTYEGAWHTTNRKLDGTLTCVVSDLGAEQWRGRFYGVWQGTPFDYTVAFSGPPSDLHGTAVIDGADYSWTGQIASDAPRAFKGSFGGSRYAGYFDLKEKKAVILK
jgi:hypothetical protein